MSSLGRKCSPDLSSVDDDGDDGVLFKLPPIPAGDKSDCGRQLHAQRGRLPVASLDIYKGMVGGMLPNELYFHRHVSGGDRKDNRCRFGTGAGFIRALARRLVAASLRQLASSRRGEISSASLKGTWGCSCRIAAEYRTVLCKSSRANLLSPLHLTLLSFAPTSYQLVPSTDDTKPSHRAGFRNKKIVSTQSK
jgi:hypothetical protein